MAKAKKEYVSMNGKKVLLDLNDQKENDRPHKYFCVDADFGSDVAEKLNLADTTINHVFNEVMTRGLKSFGLEPEAYNFTRSMQPSIRNVGKHPQQVAAYGLLMNPPTPTPVIAADITPATTSISPLAQKWINGLIATINQKIAENQPINAQQLRNAVDEKVPETIREVVFSESLKAIPTIAEAKTPVDFSF